MFVSLFESGCNAITASYRSIGLTTAIGKTMEPLVATRLSEDAFTFPASNNMGSCGSGHE